MCVGALAEGPASPARGSEVPRARVAVVVEFLLHVHHVAGRLLEGPVRPPAQLPQAAQLGQPGPRAVCGAGARSGRGQGGGVDGGGARWVGSAAKERRGRVVFGGVVERRHGGGGARSDGQGIWWGRGCGREREPVGAWPQRVIVGAWPGRSVACSGRGVAWGRGGVRWDQGPGRAPPAASLTVAPAGPPGAHGAVQDAVHPHQEPADAESEQQPQHEVDLLLGDVVCHEVVLGGVHHRLVPVVRDHVVDVVPGGGRAGWHLSRGAGSDPGGKRYPFALLVLKQP